MEEKPEENPTMSFSTLYSSPNIIRAMKSRKVEWAGHVAYTGGKRNA
jgi:hypothetical protein